MSTRLHRPYGHYPAPPHVILHLALFGIFVQMHPCGCTCERFPSFLHSPHRSNNVAEMAAMRCLPARWCVGMIGTEVALSVQATYNGASPLLSLCRRAANLFLLFVTIDQFDKADAPPISGTYYIYPLRAMPRLTLTTSQGIPSLFSTPSRSKNRPGSTEPTRSCDARPKPSQPGPGYELGGWPAVLEN